MGLFIMNPILYCEETSANVQTSIQVLHDHFFELLKAHVRQPDFILTFGTSKITPGLQTLFYKNFILDDVFIKTFLNNISWEELIYNNNKLLNVALLHSKIYEKFYTYIEQEQFNVKSEITTSIIIIMFGIDIKDPLVILKAIK